jgi:ABC-type transport system involved in multi-copper enzyme maturation permease subunit
MAFSRIVVIARHVFLEVIRDRVLYLMALFALVMLAAAVLLPPVSAGTDQKILLDLGLAAMHLLSVIVAVFVGTGLVNKEIEKRTVLVLLAKPVRRSEFIVGKHLGLSAVLAVLLGGLGLMFTLLLLATGVLFSFASLALATGFMLLEAMLLTAVALLFGVFTSSLLATLLTFAVYLMGHLTQDLVAFAQSSEKTGLQQVITLGYLVLPDLERLNLRNLAVYGLELLPDALTLLAHLAYGLVYSALLLLLATVVFSRRQF